MTDGGIETTLIFHDGLDLPEFAAFHLLRDDEGTAALDGSRAQSKSDRFFPWPHDRKATSTACA